MTRAAFAPTPPHIERRRAWQRDPARKRFRVGINAARHLVVHDGELLLTIATTPAEAEAAIKQQIARTPRSHR